MSRTSRFLPLSLVGLLTALPALAADWQALLGNSPFGGSAETAAAPASGEVEFRGVVQEGDVVLVNLYNPTTKTGSWVPVQGQAAGVTVQTYDAQAGRINIATGGRQLTLSLKQAKVALVQPTPAAAAGGQAGQPGQPGQPGQGGEGGRGQMPDFLRNLPPEARAALEAARQMRREQREGGGTVETTRQFRLPGGERMEIRTSRAVEANGRAAESNGPRR